MPRLKALFLRLLLVAVFAAVSPFALAQNSAPKLAGLIVDKKNNSLHLVTFTEAGYTVQKTFHTTLGLAAGDKEKEGDKKTPEGIYFFEELKRPPRLLKKFGNLALTMNFPNPWDRFMGKSGSGIWLHATDEPKRLDKDFDSLGCVVVRNEEIEELLPRLTYRTSPVLVFDDFEKRKELLKPERLAALVAFVKGWAHNWSEKNMENYIHSYHAGFSSNGKDRKQWRAYKGQLNQQYASISVKLTHLFVFAHPKYDVAIFKQVYESRLKNGKVAKRTEGVKILYLANEDGAPKILSEEFRDTQL
ncbi:MAG: L,D-transpeptidase [Deltaproteobacteria bacterium]|nr:L,D-transpeptidase [Deltaproteobacteria bacterium]